MKKNILLIFIACCFVIACNNTKRTTSTTPGIATLEGNWEMNYISGPGIAFDSLYPNKKPTISFDVAAKKVAGNTSCNGFMGPLKADGNKIDFNDPMAMTKMMCQGEGETVFLEGLRKITNWSVTDGTTLNLIMGDISTMRFTKK